MNYKNKQSLPYDGKKIAILGYGLEGQDAEKYFLEMGITPVILDRKDDPDYLSKLKSFDVVVRSPGVYRYLPEIVEAEKDGVIITSAIKIFFENCPAKIIGVTGTKGKGTASTLIYEILKADARGVYLSGNIGKPYLELLPKLSSESFVVMEMSSFQLIDLNISPYIAVVLNITSDHMDWHKDQDEYLNAKKNIVRFQSASDFAIINEEYESSRNFSKISKAKVVFFSKGKLDSKYKNDLLLRGEHNLENIAAAVAAARCLNIKDATILKVVKNFKGLEHRLELVDTINGVTFYNDSFATGPQPTIAAINSFTEPETLILGGSDKGLDYRDLGEVINQKENVKNIILIGEIGEKIGKEISGKNIVNLGKTSMIRIIEKAIEVTEKGGVVILSPAAASFDMFKNYKDRGNQFKEAVQKLK
jgi:UDP-N-acetylmuramoylalanine--D-glutamate ligase